MGHWLFLISLPPSLPAACLTSSSVRLFLNPQTSVLNPHSSRQRRQGTGRADRQSLTVGHQSGSLPATSQAAPQRSPSQSLSSLQSYTLVGGLDGRASSPRQPGSCRLGVDASWVHSSGGQAALPLSSLFLSLPTRRQSEPPVSSLC